MLPSIIFTPKVLVSGSLRYTDESIIICILLLNDSILIVFYTNVIAILLNVDSVFVKNYKSADQLAVNNNGELIEQKDSNSREEATTTINEQQIRTNSASNRSLIDVLKMTLTTKKGFGEYWKFMKSKFK